MRWRYDGCIASFGVRSRARRSGHWENSGCMMVQPQDVGAGRSRSPEADWWGVATRTRGAYGTGGELCQWEGIMGSVTGQQRDSRHGKRDAGDGKSIRICVRCGQCGGQVPALLSIPVGEWECSRCARGGYYPEALIGSVINRRNGRYWE